MEVDGILWASAGEERITHALREGGGGRKNVLAAHTNPPHPTPTALLRGMVGGGLIDIGWRIRERGVRSENAAFVFHLHIFRILSRCAKGRRIAPVLYPKRKRKVIEQLNLTCQMRSRMEKLGPGGKSVYSGQRILALSPPLFSRILDILSARMALPPPKNIVTQSASCL